MKNKTVRKADSTESNIIGLDIGGSKINGLLLDSQLDILHRFHFILERKEADYLEEAIVKVSQELIRQAGIRERSLAGIGIALPGYVDPIKGCVINASNLNVKRWNVRGIISNRFKSPVYIENDVNAAALGEYHKRKAQGKNIIFISIGTGVGMGVIMDGRIFRGDFGLAGELGHFIIDPHGPLCKCGNRGCLEAYAGGWGIAERYLSSVPDHNDVNGTVSAEDVARKAKAGDPIAGRVYEEAAGAMGLAIANVINIFSIGRIVLGGGIAIGNPTFLPSIHRRISQYLLPDLQGKIQVERSLLGLDAGAFGGGALVYQVGSVASQIL